jgi:AcrR family transcriptional regulator
VSGQTQEQHARRQLARLHASVIELVAEHGYAALSIRDLRAVSGAPAQFRSKESYFIATYDFIVLRAMRRINAAYRSELDGASRLSRVIEALAELVLEEPRSARLVLVEALGAGPLAVCRVEQTSGALERMIGACLAGDPNGVGLPPLALTGIVGGITGVVRQRIVDDRVEELGELTQELLRWATSYRHPAGSAFPVAPEPQPVLAQPLLASRGPGFAGGATELERVLYAAANIAADETYEKLTVAKIIDRTGITSADFHAMFDDCEQCFLAIFDLLGVGAISSASDAMLAREDWRTAIRDGIAATLADVAHDPVFGRIAFVEIFAVGPAGIRHYSALMQSFADLLRNQVPYALRPSEAVAEAIGCAIWQIAHRYVVRGSVHQLEELVDYATYLALTPLIGPESAISCDPAEYE